MHKMPRVKFDPSQSVLVIIDVQPVLTKTIYEVDRVLSRITFLAKVAKLLGVPILATEQNPNRMGTTEARLLSLVDTPKPFSKMAFSAMGCPEFVTAVNATGRKQFIIVGLETHICVTQTAHDLIENGYEVVVCPDGVSSRSLEQHKLGMERLRDAGVVPAHTESVAYEWLGTATHPLFKAFLAIVKEYA